MKEYAYNVVLNAVVRVVAPTEMEARELVDALDLDVMELEEELEDAIRLRLSEIRRRREPLIPFEVLEDSTI